MNADNVIERINNARRIIAAQGFAKSGQVKGGQSYNFIPISQILDAVRKAHAEAGVTVMFGAPEYDTEQNEKRYTYTKKGQYGDTQWTVANGHIHATIFGGSVEDCIETDVPFEAQDNSDKLTNKIVTNAERCLYRVLYAIDEGDATDPEAFHEEIPAEVKVEEPKKKTRKVNPEDPFFGNAEKETAETKNLNYSEHCRKVLSKWTSETDVNDIPDWVLDYFKANGPLKTMAPGLVVRLHSEMKAQCIKLPEVE